MFFDGEEAFQDWTSTDSIYGARNFANQLEKNFKQNAFDSIDMFVLLDLIGGDRSTFPNYFPSSTSSAYKILNSIGKISSHLLTIYFMFVKLVLSF
jgi:glutaminyl-peptide cyclotransferase